METTHVFIVDTTTLKYHLEYQFAGTGARDLHVDFNANPNTNLTGNTENNLVRMIADSQRVREDDFVIFYLQQNKSQGIHDGKFYGIFKVREAPSFLDNNDRNQFLKRELVKSLTFRTLIKPYEIYAQGVTEWEALDEIKYIQSPNQMLWSLIYRKLKGNRGNTMITIYESERLFKLLRDKNNRQTLNGSRFTFDISTQEVQLDGNSYTYTGRKEAIGILPRLISKYSGSKAFEAHLQAYILQNIGRNTNKSLDDCLLSGLSLEWIGNEVSCGVGMQRIDIMLSAMKDNTRVIIPIELKADEATKDNVYQIQRYVDWLEQYYIPNRISDIEPILVSKRAYNKSSLDYRETIDCLVQFNRHNSRCLPLKYVEYGLTDNSLEFKEVTY